MNAPPARHKRFAAKLIALFLAALLSLAALCAWKLAAASHNNALRTLEDAALRDRRMLQIGFELILDELAGIARRVELAKPADRKALQECLRRESATTFFSHLYFLAENGKVYADNSLVYEKAPKFLEAAPGFSSQAAPLAKGARFILDYSESSQFLSVRARDMVIYGISLGATPLGGRTITAIAGSTRRDFLRRHFLAAHFNAIESTPDSSRLIDMTGHYVINSPQSAAPGRESNFFRRLSEMESASLSGEEIRAAMRAGETFSFQGTGREGKTLHLLMPFEDDKFSHPRWYLALSAGESLFGPQRTAWIVLGLSLLGVAALFMGGLTFWALRADRKLNQAGEQIKARGDFLSSMSHEIRTPLNGLIGLNYLITTHLGEPEKLPQIRDWLGKSRSLADYLLSLLNDILDMSKLQAGKIDINDQPFSIDAMLDDVWCMQSANMEKNGIRFAIKKDARWPWITGDETRTKQILTNLLGNALKFTPKNGSVTLSVSQESPEPGRVVTTYRCEDSGVGMSEAFIRKIFEPFTQEGGAQAAQGTGLGMPICKELAEAMGGSIEVESALGEGSAFIVRIPSLIADPWAAEDAPADDAAPAREAKGDAPPGKKKILLAEDSEFNAEFLKELLEDEGFEVALAENGRIALDLFRASPPGDFGIILMDMQMPVMDGCEAAAAIRALDRPDAKTVPIFACTASAFRDDLEKAMQSGMNDFLTKPINIGAFLEKLKKTAARQCPVA